MIPSAFLPIQEIPLTPNGKVDRKRLPVPKGFARERSAATVSPRSGIERQLAKLWSDVLGIDRVGIRDNFFELGGHSLLLIRVHAGMRKELDVHIPVVDLFRYPTIESMAACLERRLSETTVAVGANF
jgi:acyl carrier protein